MGWRSGCRDRLLREGFGTTVLHRVGVDDEIVAQLAVGDARFWVSNTGPGRLDPRIVRGTTSRTLLVVANPDEVAANVVAAGAVQTSKVDDEHGWRLGRSWTRSGTSGKSAIPWATGRLPRSGRCDLDRSQVNAGFAVSYSRSSRDRSPILVTDSVTSGARLRRTPWTQRTQVE